MLLTVNLDPIKLTLKIWCSSVTLFVSKARVFTFLWRVLLIVPKYPLHFFPESHIIQTLFGRTTCRCLMTQKAMCFTYLSKMLFQPFPKRKRMGYYLDMQSAMTLLVVLRLSLLGLDGLVMKKLLLNGFQIS